MSRSINIQRKVFFGAGVFLSLAFCISAFAKDINFEVSLDRNKISLGSSIQLNLSFQGTQDIPAPDLGTIEGIDWQYLGPSTMMSIFNSKVSTSIIHMYRVIPLKTGKFMIPSFTVTYKGKDYSSSPIALEVVKQPVGLSPEQGNQNSSLDEQALEDRIFLVMEVDKKKAYLNEIIPVRIKLYVNKLAVRDIQYPEIVSEGFSVEKLAKPNQYREVLGGIACNVIEFNTEIFALRAGELNLGPAKLKCNLLIKKESRRHPRSFLFDDDFFEDFFGRYQSYPLNLKSAGYTLTIMDLPRKGKPDGYQGAVGNYKFYLEANPKEVKVGDPITLKMLVIGEGNFKTVKAPEFNPGDDFKIYDSEVKLSQSGKMFEQVIIPKKDSITEIPMVSFTFFDTESGTYKTLKKGPRAITVNSLPAGADLKVLDASGKDTSAVPKKEILGRDIIYIKDSPGKLKKKGNFLYKNKVFVAIQFIPLAVIISVLVFRMKKERLRTDIPYARRLRAPRKAKKNLAETRRFLDTKDAGKFFDSAFRTLREYLGDKFHLPTAGITSDIVEELKRYNVEEEVLNKLKECFGYCDKARYAALNISEKKMLKTFNLAQELIDEFERIKT